ncbi:response regulator [Sabulicella glaciei]|uniref:Response regulator n=1 Tax=Sabulicella glaciei TaxID=2984948 RepID=A0ABT3P1J8_9PROT|nr:response regulator [Roseococcus sp. MDT2-1-1]MCW8088266.1 response regulator [Roseococcus sp. MDT2-1-1]
MAAAPRGSRVLVVEDEPVLALFVAMVLERLGCRVIGPVAQAEQAATLAASEPLDAAVLDFNLGHGETSEPALRCLAERHVPVLLVTGSASQLEQTGLDVPVLPKPVTEKQLATAVQQLLGEK